MKHALECPINIECKVDNILNLGSHHLIVGKVIEKLIDEDISETNLHECLNPVAYFRPNYYSINKTSLGTYGKSHDTI